MRVGVGGWMRGSGRCAVGAAEEGGEAREEGERGCSVVGRRAEVVRAEVVGSWGAEAD